MCAWIRHHGCAGIRDERDRFAAAQPLDETGRACVLVVLMETRRGRRDRVVLKDPGGPPGVLRCDERHLTEDPQGPERDVVEISDGRRDNI